MPWVFVIVALAVSIAALYFGVRYFLLKQSLRSMNERLQSIVDDLDENRIMRLPQPDRDIENLLVTVNELLSALRQKAVGYARREAELKAQIEYISHDLRTPLTSIQGYLSFIDVEKLDEDGKEAFKTIRRKAESLQRLIVQFYELSRLDSDEVSLDLKLQDVGYILHESLLSHYGLLTKRGLEVRVTEIARDAGVLGDAEGEKGARTAEEAGGAEAARGVHGTRGMVSKHPIEARVDSDALERIFANLLENAGRYAKTKLQVTLEENDTQIAIVFSNDVEDAEEIEVEKLFDPLYTQDRSRTQESTGLGLAIARRLAAHMNAHLETCVETWGGERLIRFTLILPREVL
jgi:signal transduction histidine kinase